MRFTVAVAFCRGSPRREANKKSVKWGERETKTKTLTAQLSSTRCHVGQCYWHTFDVPSTVCALSANEVRHAGGRGISEFDKRSYRWRRITINPSSSSMCLVPSCWIRRYVVALVDYGEGGESCKLPFLLYNIMEYFLASLELFTYH